MNLTFYVWRTRFRQFEKRSKLYGRIVHVFNYSSVNDWEAFKGPTSCSLIFKQCHYMYLENKKMDRHIFFGHGTYTCTLYMCYMCIYVINIFWFETCIYLTTMKIIRATQLVSLICASICMHAGSLQEHVTYNYLLIYPTLHILRKKILGGGGASIIYSLNFLPFPHIWTKSTGIWINLIQCIGIMLYSPQGPNNIKLYIRKIN